MVKYFNDYCLLGVTNDELELPIQVFSNYLEMAIKLDISYSHARQLVSQGFVFKKTGLKYIKVWFHND